MISRNIDIENDPPSYGGGRSTRTPTLTRAPVGSKNHESGKDDDDGDVFVDHTVLARSTANGGVHVGAHAAAETDGRSNSRGHTYTNHSSAKKNNVFACLIPSRSCNDRDTKKKSANNHQMINPNRSVNGPHPEFSENGNAIQDGAGAGGCTGTVTVEEKFRALEMKVENLQKHDDSQKMKIQELEEANERSMREMREANEHRIQELEQNHGRKMQELEHTLDEFRSLLSSPADPDPNPDPSTSNRSPRGDDPQQDPEQQQQQQQQNRAITTTTTTRRSTPYSVNRNYHIIFGKHHENNNDDDNDDGEENLEECTFSLMMISKVCSRSWALGLIAFWFQITLGFMIALDQASLSTNSSLFDVPFRVTLVVRVAQFCSIILCLATQSDILTSVHSVVLLSRGSDWDVVISEEENKTTCLWIIRILLPNLLKFIQGLIVMFVSFVIIVQSDDIIVLLKDFTALMVLSETDNILFDVASMGYLGPTLAEQAAKVSNTTVPTKNPTESSSGEIMESPSNSNFNSKTSYTWRPFVLLFLFAPLFGGWIMIVRNQINGAYFRDIYPKCNFTGAFDLALKNFGDGSCYGGPLNSLECEFEGGDCIDFNIAYPLCKGRDDLIDVQEKVGNGVCDELFNIPECDFDGGDCCPPEIFLSASFGDNQCHGGFYTTAGCLYDNGDCHLFNRAHPTCPLTELSDIEGAGDIVLGNGICESGVYSSEECGWEDGDCDIGQIGQEFDCGLRGGSLDGRTLVTGPQCTSDPTIGPITVYHYNDSNKKWEPLGDAFTSEENNTETFGYSISMNESGNRIAIGDPMNDSGSGQVRVYDYIASNETWVQVGQTLHGELGSMFGSKMDVTSNGSRLVISSSGMGQGQIFIYELDTTGHNRHRLGNVIEGKTFSDLIGGRYVRISSEDGNTIIFSTGSLYYSEDASARIYRYDKDILDWIQLGNDIPNPNSGEDAASISSDGKRIAIASNGLNGDAPGQVQVFHYEENSESWVQVGKPIFSADSYNGDGFGGSMGMSGDGTILSIFSGDPNCFSTLDCPNPWNIQTFILDVVDLTDLDFIRAGPRLSQLSQNSNMIVKSENDGPNTLFPLVISGLNLLSGDGSTLFVSGMNFDDESTFGRVYDLSQLFYIRCPDDTVEFDGGSIIVDIGCNDKYPYNTEQCGFDRGDCPIFPVEGYPGCFVTNPAEIGNGRCHPNREMYNTPECGYDGGDCPPPQAVEGYPKCLTLFDSNDVGNGQCDTWLNTPECGYDGGDCIPKPVDGYLDCFVLRPDWIGNGVCDSSYNTIECGYDGGDCVL